MGRRVSRETAGYLGTPIASSPPHSSRGQRKKEAKLGSSCSSIKRFRVHFSPSSGGSRPFPGPLCVQSVPSPHTQLFAKSGRFPEEHPVCFWLGQPYPFPSEPLNKPPCHKPSSPDPRGGQFVMGGVWVQVIQHWGV